MISEIRNKLLISGFTAMIAGAFLANCGGSSFKGSSGITKKGNKTEDDSALPGSHTVEPGNTFPPKAEIDYSVCASLPENGKRGTGQCNANEVIVIVNDGTAGEMTCCPVGANVFSTEASERNIRRVGKCGQDEVATGIEDLSKSIVICTKVDTRFLKTEFRATSIYAKSGSTGNLGTLAKAYNIGDCCVCPEGSVFAGNHTSSDNKCTDECVAIVKK